MDNLKLKKINDIRIIPLKNSSSQVCNCKMFELPYFNLALMSKKNTGKSTIIYNILKNRGTFKNKILIKDGKEDINRRTIIILCSPNLNNDKIYQFFVENMTNPKEILENAMKLKKGETVHKTIIELPPVQKEKEENNKLKIKKFVGYGFLSFSEHKEEIMNILQQSRNAGFSSILVVDDLGNELKDLSSLIKGNRHLFCSTIISTQYTNDIVPGIWANLDYFFLSRNLNIEKLEEIYNKSGLSISLEKFLDIYLKITSKPYSWMYVRTSNGEIRNNFDTMVLL